MGHVRLELTTLRLRGTCNACQAHSPYVNLLYHIFRSKGKIYDGKLLNFVLPFGTNLPNLPFEWIITILSHFELIFGTILALPVSNNRILR